MPDQKPDGLTELLPLNLDRDTDLGLVYDDTAGTLKKIRANAAFPSAARGKDSGAWVNVFDVGAIGDGASADAIWINFALNSLGVDGTLYFPAGTYVIGTGLQDITNSGVRLVGEGPSATELVFEPTANDQTAITFDGSGQQTGCGISNMKISTSTNLYRKTALEVTHQEGFVLDNVHIEGFDGASTDSVGLQTRGVLNSSFTNLYSAAIIPIRLDNNPDSSDDVISTSFRNCKLVSPSDNPDTLTKACVLIDEGVFFRNMTFEGFQEWSGADYGLYYDSSGSAPTDWPTCKLSNIHTSGGDDNANAWSVYIKGHSTYAPRSIDIAGCVFEAARNGVYLDTVMAATLTGVTLTQTSVLPLDASTNVRVLVLFGCFTNEFSGTAPLLGSLRGSESYGFAFSQSALAGTAIYSLGGTSNTSSIGGKQVITRSALPTSALEYYNVGDRIENSAPVAGGNIGWVCVSAGYGTSGSPDAQWEPYGVIATLQYREGSIYSGDKSVTTSWQTEAVATGVDVIKVTNNEAFDVEIGYGDTETAASALKRLVPAGDTRYILLFADYIGWRGDNAITVHIEQSVFR